MEAMLNCGACPDLHRFDDVEAVLFIRRIDGELRCEAYVPGQYIVVVPGGKNEYKVFNSRGWKAKHYKVIGDAIEHLAQDQVGNDPRS